MPDGRILIADDEDSLRWVLEKGFRGAGYQVTAVKDGTAALREAEAETYDLVLLDVRMPGIDGLSLLETLKDRRPDAHVVIMTAHGTMQTAVQAMQKGAYDYLAKPFDLDEALLLAERALSARRLTQEVASLRTGLKEVWEFGALVGRHPTMQEVYKTIGRVAGSDVSVLLRGESGTGKEVVARALHHYSRRAGRPFVGISAAAIPATLLESELFGHEKGAFTGAKDRRLGKLELAHGGTLFLDEIGDMPPELQVKLLRVLQERAFERVGGHELIRIDVRVLAATHRDLEAMMKEGRFREDLFYRLNVVTLALPALRERRGDIPLLAEHFLAKHAESLGERVIAPDAMERLAGLRVAGQRARARERHPARDGDGRRRRRAPRASADRAHRVEPGRGGRRRRDARGDHRAEDARVRAGPARAHLGEPARAHGRAGREAAAPGSDARDPRQPGAGRPAPRDQPQHPAQEAQGPRDRSRRRLAAGVANPATRRIRPCHRGGRAGGAGALPGPRCRQPVICGRPCTEDVRERDGVPRSMGPGSTPAPPARPAFVSRIAVLTS